MHSALHKNFLKAVQSLGMKFPVKELSDKLGYGQPTVSEYLSSKKEVSVVFAKKFCAVYKLDYEKMAKPDETGFEIDAGLAKSDNFYKKIMRLFSLIPEKDRTAEAHKILAELILEDEKTVKDQGGEITQLTEKKKNNKK